ncbi:hypothetical protein JEQ12_001345 [Ovis aries]|uniref:Morc S5 domain-containing protein n=1 Tax=Ovis aries TaxID=9940 RepID=A0A836AEP8_SHEEP|nr:hypothetical protein JEQ12_001345 [Ovis aries]
MGDKYPALLRAQLHLDFIHANSTTHSFLFGALAELLDNARDAGAARLDVFSVDNEELQGGFMLCFLDDGCGMSPEEASDIIYFGTSKKRLSTLKFIGQYGNGLKSGSMRIGKDFILFTKKEETMTCVFFSQTFCEREGLSEVVVPIPSWLTRTRESVTDDPQKFSTELSIIYKYSPFKTEAELMQQFNVIYGKCGTLLVIYNLKLLLSGEPELDVKTDREDILVAGALGEKYMYVTSSFKGAFKCEVKKAEEAVKRAELILKEAQIKVNYSDRTSLSSSAKDVLQKALEDVKAKQKILQEKQRELKKARTLTLFFGVNIENRSQAGMFIYSNNRLIKMHEKVGPQLKLKSLLGAGVVGIVNIPLEIMEPSHNKQEFLNVHEYNHLLKVMGQYLVQYCKDTRISNRNLTLFWNEFGYPDNKDMEKSSDSVQYQRRQAMAIPCMIQCGLDVLFIIKPQFIPVNSITEFTSPCQASASKGNKKIQRIRPSSDDLKHESLSSFELLVNHRGWKKTEGSDSDVEFISETKIMKKSGQKKVKPQQQSYCSEYHLLSMPVEDLNPSSGYKARVSVSGGCKVASSLTESSQSTSVKETVRKLTSNLREILLYFFPEYQLPSEFGQTSLEELTASSEIRDVYMVQYEKKLKTKIQSVICDANQREMVNEVSLGQCEKKRKLTEDKLNKLRVKLAVLLQKLQLGGPAGDLEQIDAYLEALLKEDNLLFQKAFVNKVTTDTGHRLLLEKKENISQN